MDHSMTNNVMTGKGIMDAVMTGIEKGIAIAGQGTVSIQQGSMGIREKLGILTDAAKYDAACTSSGVNRKGDGHSVGNLLNVKGKIPFDAGVMTGWYSPDMVEFC